MVHGQNGSWTKWFMDKSCFEIHLKTLNTKHDIKMEKKKS